MKHPRGSVAIWLKRLKLHLSCDGPVMCGLRACFSGMFRRRSGQVPPPEGTWQAPQPEQALRACSPLVAAGPPSAPALETARREPDFVVADSIVQRMQALLAEQPCRLESVEKYLAELNSRCRGLLGQ